MHHTDSPRHCGILNRGPRALQMFAMACNLNDTFSLCASQTVAHDDSVTRSQPEHDLESGPRLCLLLQAKRSIPRVHPVP
jgi:hypothetical protein